MMSSCSTQRHLFFILLFLITYLHLPNHQVTPISFNYTRFDRGNFTDYAGSCPEDTHKFCLQGHASQVRSDHSIQFTNGGMSSGWAVYSEAFPLWKRERHTTTSDDLHKVTTNFTTRFSIDLTKNNNGNCSAADGLAFFLSPYPHRIPPDHDGPMLGLVSSSNISPASESSSFVAVEIDTYSNLLWDPPYIHLGIDVNSIKSKVEGNISTLAGEADAIEAIVRVDYDSATGNLTTIVEDHYKVYANLSYHVDLSGILPELVAVGISATTGFCTEYYKITSWSFNSTWDRVKPTDRKKKTQVVVLIVAIVVGLALLLGVLRIIVRRVTVKEAEGGEEENDAIMMSEELADAGGPRRLDYNDLVAATGNFDEKRKLGGGGSGTVYRGCLRELKCEAAIKRVSSRGDSRRGRKEYMAEVKVISRLRHRNLVQLVGWCHQNGEFLLAYEFMPNLSLDCHLIGKGGLAPLAWPVRYNIAVGVASALLYLHEEGDQCVVHRNMKSSNVMLDENFNAKLGDFGLARFTEHGHALQTTMLGGTLGYMAPECFYTGRASIESDVYAFGVVVLEIATGRRAIEGDEKEEVNKVSLLHWVWDRFAKDAIVEAADGRLDLDSIDQRQMERLLVVGLWCAHPDARCRPSIRKVIAALNFEDVKIHLPREMPVSRYAAPQRRGDQTWQLSSSLANFTMSSLYYDGR